jgi:methionyl-tRNA formyltransferase
MNIVIIGRNQVLYETARKLLADGQQIKCIITAPAAPEYTKTQDDFEALAQEIGAAYFLAGDLDDPAIKDACQGLDLGISINWVSVIEQRHIDCFKLGILNAHHGDLPEYRGNACSNWAIINNEENITNSIHFMEGDRLDCGRVICQEHFYLGDDKTITDVYKWSEQTTPALFAKALGLLRDDSSYMLKYADPDAPQSFRCYPRLPEDNFINWDLPVRQIHNLIRAMCAPFPGAYTYHRFQDEIKKLHILKSRVVQTESRDVAAPGHVLENNPETGESLVQCGQGVIALAACRYDGETEEFAPGRRWKSIRMRLGMRPDDWLWELTKSRK